MKARNFLLLVLTVILAISLVACGDNGDDTVGVQGSPDGTGAVEQTGTNTDDGDDTVAEAVTVNEINGMKYVSEEEYEGEVYTVVNYMFEDDVNIVEFCFWTIDTEEEYAVVDEIINTIKMN